MARTGPVVLVAEDDQDLLGLLSDCLESEGYVPLLARNGRQALELSGLTPPALVVLDMMMPGLDGLAFLKAFRSRTEARTPVLAISAFEPYLTEALGLGATAALSKPFGVDSFMQEVNGLILGAVPGQPTGKPVPFDENQRLRAVLELQLDRASPSEALQQFTSRVSRIFDVPICLVSIVTRERQFWHAHTGLPPDLAKACGTRREDSFCTHAVAAKAALVVQDTEENPFFQKNVLVRERGLRFYAGVPLLNSQGLPMGTLCLLDFKGHAFSSFDLELLSVLARRVIAELEWRVKRLHPGMRAGPFREFSWLDQELDIPDRQGFTQALLLESLRAAERKVPLTLIVLELSADDLKEPIDALKLTFPRAIVGRLESRRVGAIVSGESSGVVLERAQGIAGGHAVAVVVPRLLGDAVEFLHRVEMAFSPMSAEDSPTVM